MNRLKMALALFMLVTCVTPTRALGQRPALGDLAFLEGHWKGEKDGEQFEEIWTAPQSGSIVGVYRLMEGDKTTLYELIVVQVLERGPVLRLKHFSETLTGWEDKDKATDLPVIRVGKNEVVFESDDKERLTRLTYRRESATSLVVLLERKRDGKALANEFRFTLAK